MITLTFLFTKQPVYILKGQVIGYGDSVNGAFIWLQCGAILEVKESALTISKLISPSGGNN